MTHIEINRQEKNFELLGGMDPDTVLAQAPFEIFSEDVVNFLGELSKKLLTRNDKNSDFVEFLGFGFWARKANIESIKKRQKRYKF